MKDRHKELIVIVATLMGLDDNATKGALRTCEEALDRQGLLKRRGNPDLANVAAVPPNDEERTIAVLKRTNDDRALTAGQWHNIALKLDPQLPVKQWAFARLLSKLSEQHDWIAKTVWRGVNTFVIIGEDMDTEPTPRAPVDEVKEEPPVGVIKKAGSSQPIRDIEDARLKLQQCDYYLKDVDDKGAESPYYVGRANIVEMKENAKRFIATYESTQK